MNRLAIVALVCLGTITACAELDLELPTPNFTGSGFLSDYSDLEPHPTRASASLFAKSNTIPAAYDRVILDPIVVRLGPTSDMTVFEMIGPEEVSDYLYAAIARELRAEYTPVEEPGEGVIRVRAAITDVRPVPDPVPLWGSGATYVQEKLRSGRVGAYSIVETAIEIEAVDSRTNERLVTFTDTRSGTETVQGATIPSQIIDSIDEWARLLGKTMQRKPVI